MSVRVAAFVGVMSVFVACGEDEAPPAKADPAKSQAIDTYCAKVVECKVAANADACRNDLAGELNQPTSTATLYSCMAKQACEAVASEAARTACTCAGTSSRPSGCGASCPIQDCPTGFGCDTGSGTCKHDTVESCWACAVP